MAQQVTWFAGFRDHWLLPNYVAPWKSDPAFFTPLKFAVGRSAGILSIPIEHSYWIFVALFYILVAFSLYYAWNVFLKSSAQKAAALAVAIATVPMASLQILPLRLLGFSRLPGAADFGWHSADGFLHGIGGALSAAFGTAITVLSMALLARYVQSDRKKYLYLGGVATFTAGIIHPFEVFLITAAGALALATRDGLVEAIRGWKRTVWETLVFAGPGALAVLWFVVQSLRHPWLRAQADALKWSPGPVWGLPGILGVPATLALILIVLKPRLQDFSQHLLRTWILCALIGLYIPVLPWTQTYFNGFHYGVALFVVLRSWDWVAGASVPAWRPRLAMATLAVLLAAALTAHVKYRVQAYLDGVNPNEKRTVFFTGLQDVDEFQSISWLRTNARRSDLVLAPRQVAPWVATIPIHSFASHPNMGITYSGQRKVSDAFFDGRLGEGDAAEMLADFGIRYVMIPDGSAGIRYLSSKQPVARFGKFRIFEFSGHEMKPYPGLELAIRQTDRHVAAITGDAASERNEQVASLREKPSGEPVANANGGGR